MATRKFLRKISLNGNSLTVALPPEFVGHLKLQRGDEVVLSVLGDSILITSVEVAIGARVRSAVTSAAESQSLVKA